MKKFDKILIAMLVLLCIATILNMTLGIMCYDSYAHYKHTVWDKTTRTYLWDGTYRWAYGFGGYSIASMVLSFVALIFTILTLKLKKNPKNNLISIGALISNIAAWAMCIVALCEDGKVYVRTWYDGEIWAYWDMMYYSDTAALWIIAFICLSVVLILSCVYLGLSETARKKSLKQTKQEPVQLAQATQPTLGIDAGANELKGLKSLLDCGILSNDEFTAQKAKILASMGVTLQPKQKAKQTFIGSYVADNGIIITLNEKDFAIRKSNSANALVGTYITHLSAQCITLTRDGGGTMSLQIKDENHLVDSTGNVYVKE